MSTLDTESEYGLSFVLHSKANKDVYRDNKPTSFTNIFKKAVKLDDKSDYQIGLANIHLPIFQNVLVKNDYTRSSIRYNMGMFLYNKSLGKWNLLPNSKRELWRLAPNTDFQGIMGENITNTQKKEYFKKFANSLTLNSQSLVNENCKELFLNTISNWSGRMEKEFIDKYDPEIEKSIWFKTLPLEMTQEDRFNFFEKLVRVLSIDPITYIKDVAQSFKQRDNFVDKVFKKNSSEKGIPGKLTDLYYNDYFKSLWTYKKTKKDSEDDQNSDENVPILAMYVTFGDRMAEFLSLNQNTKIFVGYCGLQFTSPFYSNRMLVPQFEKANLDTIFIYCDLVEMSIRVGDALTNLLAIVTVNRHKIANMISPIHINRPLSHKYFQSASIIIRDQNGADINFENNSFSTLELVIKKREQ